jgi:hypothetical protein
MTDEPDDLLPLLAPHPGGELNPAALLTATTSVLRRRALVRRAAKFGGVLLVFALGGVGGWLVKPTPEREVVTVIEPMPVAVVVPLRPADPEPTDAPPSAGALELLAEQADTPAEAAKLYRAAGDRFLKDAGDYEQAVRCYRLYFRHAGNDARTVTADDSWLLMSLKTSDPKEKSDAKLDS